MTKNYSGIVPTFSGAGILVIDTYKEKPCVVLFTKNHGEYHDLGGSIDGKDKRNKYAVELTAVREAQEESANTLQIKSLKLIQSLPHIDLKYHNNYYRCYILYLKHKFPTKAYLSNVNTLTRLMGNTVIPHQWRETNKFARVYLADLMNCKNYNTCKTIDNHTIDIKDRTRNVFTQLVQTMPILKPQTGKLTIDSELWNTQTLILS